MRVRIAAALLGAFHAFNGLAMLIAPTIWWANAPGASDTGPYNPHFVADVGFAFLAGGAAFLAFAWRPRLKLLALGASGFLVFHALLHLWGVFMHGHVSNLVIDIGAVALPAFAGLALVWPRSGRCQITPIRFSASAKSAPSSSQRGFGGLEYQPLAGAFRQPSPCLPKVG